jgi:molybdopterin synthase sulfur carrier subunit
MRVLLFGRHAELAGWRERELAPPPATIWALLDALAAEDWGLAEALRAPTTVVARNRAQVRGDAPLAPGDEVAFMPPMSGG